MKLPAIAILLALLFTFAACGGGNNNNGNINGNWSASLSDTAGTTVFGFTTTFTEMSGNSLDITNFQFTTANACFEGVQTTQTGSFVLSGDFNGHVTGQLQLTISTTFPSNNNVLTLSGAATDNTISGTWTLNGGTGCTGNGTFTMTRH